MLGLKNEFIMPPIKLGYSKGKGFVNQKHIDFYKKVSKTLGAVTPEPFYLHQSLREIPTQLGIDNDDKIEGLTVLSQTIKSDGAKAIAHLNHPGRMANPKIPGNIFLSATDKACEAGGKQPAMMTENDMKDVIKLFVQVAKRAQKSGFDIIEIQAGQGYLLSQFLSPAVNDRTDKYGGSFENRIKFPLQLIQAVIDAVNMPIIVRLSVSEMTPNGIMPNEMIQFAKELQKMGVVAIHASIGTICSTPPWYFQHMFVPKGKSWELASVLQNDIDIPVIFVGQVNTHDDIDLLKNKYKATYISVGRAMIADMHFVDNYLSDNKGNYRPCLACSEGCLGGVKSGKGLGCVVNPEINNENNISKKVSSESKKIAIVGGGLAGMETALRLHQLGNKITLFEKDELGGQFNLAWLPPKKKSLKKLVDYYKKELENNHIAVIKQKATADMILSNNFEEVVIATGATPIKPKIEGLNHYYWAELLQESNQITNEKIVVIGGGLIGIEIASSLIDNNNEVIIVEMQGEVARGMEMIERKMTLKKLKEKNVRIYTGYRVDKVDELTNLVVIKGKDTIVLQDIDKIVLSIGMKSMNDLQEELNAKIPTEIVGDAQKPANAQQAIASAYNMVCKPF